MCAFFITCLKKAHRADIIPESPGKGSGRIVKAFESFLHLPVISILYTASRTRERGFGMPVFLFCPGSVEFQDGGVEQGRQGNRRLRMPKKKKDQRMFAASCRK